KAYCIHYFCLGHTKIITKIVATPTSTNQNLLISGSGDGTVALWDITNGKRLCSVDIGTQLNLPDAITIPTSYLSSQSLVVILIEESNELQLYKISEVNSEYKLDLFQKIKLPSFALDAKFDKNGNL